jgi:hypothetical protein
MSIYIFGDSFTELFSLVDNKNLNVITIKGSTIRGITKPNNENRLKIINTLKKANNIKCLIFNFGQVDIYFSYYYKYVKNEKFEMEKIVKNYVEFIANLPYNCNKIVFAIYPHFIKDENWFKTLLNYYILTQDEIDTLTEKEKKILSSMNFRSTLVKLFNKLLEIYCKIYNLTYINFEDELLDKNDNVKNIFYSNISIYNIHLLWKPLLPLLVKKLKNCNIGEKFKVDLHKTSNEYKKNKKESIEKKKFLNKPKKKKNKYKNIFL